MCDITVACSGRFLSQVPAFHHDAREIGMTKSIEDCDHRKMPDVDDACICHGAPFTII